MTRNDRTSGAGDAMGEGGEGIPFSDFMYRLAEGSVGHEPGFIGKERSGTRAYLWNRIMASVRSFLKTTGILDDAQIKADAFEELSNQLFRMRWIRAVAVRGFGRSSNAPHASNEVTILVLASEHPPYAQEEIDRLVRSVNMRYGTTLKAVLVDRELFSLLHAL